MNLHVNLQSVCKVTGCDRTDRVAQSRGYCHMHYGRLRRTGTTERHVPTLMERVEPKIRRDESGCWEWQAYRNHAGYGQVGLNGRLALAHRAVYEALVGPIPEGMSLDHLCRNPPCVNPEHLEPVTHAENMRRGDFSRNGEHLRRRTHCPRGHTYDAANTREYRGSRYCRACAREKWHERKAVMS